MAERGRATVFSALAASLGMCLVSLGCQTEQSSRILSGPPVSGAWRAQSEDWSASDNPGPAHASTEMKSVSYELPQRSSRGGSKKVHLTFELEEAGDTLHTPRSIEGPGPHCQEGAEGPAPGEFPQ